VTTTRVHARAADGTSYRIRHDAGFVSFDRASGRLLERWPLPDAGGHPRGIAGSPPRSGDLAVVATIDGSLYAFPLTE